MCKLSLDLPSPPPLLIRAYLSPPFPPPFPPVLQLFLPLPSLRYPPLQYLFLPPTVLVSSTPPSYPLLPPTLLPPCRLPSLLPFLPRSLSSVSPSHSLLLQFSLPPLLWAVWFARPSCRSHIAASAVQSNTFYGWRVGVTYTYYLGVLLYLSVHSKQIRLAPSRLSFVCLSLIAYNAHVVRHHLPHHDAF